MSGNLWRLSPQRPRGLVLAAFVATAVIASGARAPIVLPAIGLWLTIGLPVQLLYAKVDWPASEAAERLVYAVATALLLVIGVAFAGNLLLPYLGIERPLARLPVLVFADLSAVALLSWRPHRWRWRAPGPPSRPAAFPQRDRLVVGGAAVVVLLAVAGATRLNNGAGGSVSLLALVGTVVVVVLLLAWRRGLRPIAVAASIYLLSLGLLLLTSLRGWYVSGHDVQVEFLMFRIAQQHEHWSMDYFHGAYFACLSITVLPTVLWQLTGIADDYVYKVLFQMFFALCPVAVHLISRRFVSTGPALLATVYFIGFPTFLNDMAFVNRQEIALLFLAAGILVITSTNLSVGRRRTWFAAFSVGVVLAHYSTTYLLIGVLMSAQGARAVAAVGRWSADRLHSRRRRGSVTSVAGASRGRIVLGVANTAFVAVIAALWTGPVTHTGGQAQLTLAKMVHELTDPVPGHSAQSSDVLYNLLSKGRPKDSSQKLADYAGEMLAATSSARSAHAYPALAVAQRFPAPAIGEARLPLTAAGKALERVGFDVSALHAAIRQGSAKVLQVFVAVGLAAVALRHRRWRAVTPEFLFLGLGSFAVLVSLVVLPQVSADYGLLRAFLQVLVVLAPFLALGGVLALRWLGRASTWAASGVALLYFSHLTGIVPQVLGGYPPSMQLNNSGTYYDLYYARSSERVAGAWLASGQKVPDDQIQTNPSTRLRLQTFIRKDPGPLNDIYPTLIRTDTYVFLGDMTMNKGESAMFYQGDQLLYRYPRGFLDFTKNLVYSNGTVGIYGPRP